MDSSSVARGLSIAVADPAAASARDVVIPVQSMIPPSLTVQATANTGDNVSVQATTNDSDGFTTTGVQLYDGASLLGSMTNGGGGNWTFTINSVTAGSHILTARRVTAGGTVDSSPRTLAVSDPGIIGALNVDTGTGVIQTELSPGDGTVIVRTA